MWLKSHGERSYEDGVINNVVLTDEKNLIPGIQPIWEFHCVMCAGGATMTSKPPNFIE